MLLALLNYVLFSALLLSLCEYVRTYAARKQKTEAKLPF